MADPRNPQLSLRPAQASDALCLGVLATQVFLDTYCSAGIRPTVAREVLAACSTRAFEQTLSQPAARICVAEREGHLVGFAEMLLDHRHDTVPMPQARVAELHRLYVQRPFTGQQLGAALLAQSVAVAIESGTELLWLTVWAPNERARRFYARHGFEDRGAVWFRFEGEQHENRLLVKSLRP